MNIKSIHKGDALVWRGVDPIDGKYEFPVIVKEVHCDHILATDINYEMNLWLDLYLIKHEVYRRK